LIFPFSYLFSMGKKLKKSKSSKKKSKKEDEQSVKPTKSIKKDKKKKKKKSKILEESTLVTPEKTKKELKAEAKALKKAKKEKKKKKKKATPPPAELNSSDSDSSDETEKQPEKTKKELRAEAKALKKAKKEKKKQPEKIEEVSDSDSDSESDAPSKEEPKKATKKTESSDEGSSSDEEEPPAKVEKVEPAAKMEMDGEESSDDSSEEESAKSKKSMAKVTDEDDSDESSSDDSSDGAETEKLLKAKAEESSSSSESEKEEPAVEEVNGNKRKSNFGDGFGAKKSRTSGGQKTELKGTTKKVFVGNLSYDIDDEKIKEFFKDIGELTDIFWLTDRESGDFKGCGFLTFESTEAADKACGEMNGKDLMGRGIKIDWAEERGRGGGGKKGGGKTPPWVNNPLSPRPDNCYSVFCGNLDFNITEEDVRKHFKDCGEVKSVRWMQKEGEFKGAGFVEFTTTEGVDNAVKLCGKEIIGRAARVDYAKPRAPRD